MNPKSYLQIEWDRHPESQYMEDSHPIPCQKLSTTMRGYSHQTTRQPQLPYIWMKQLKKVLQRQRHFPFRMKASQNGFITSSRTGVGQSFHFQNRSTGLENSMLCIPSVMSVWLLTIFPQHHGTGPFHALMPVLRKRCLISQCSNFSSPSSPLSISR